MNPRSDNIAISGGPRIANLGRGLAFPLKGRYLLVTSNIFSLRFNLDKLQSILTTEKSKSTPKVYKN